jgi:hypothetical protein
LHADDVDLAESVVNGLATAGIVDVLIDRELHVFYGDTVTLRVDGLTKEFPAFRSGVVTGARLVDGELELVWRNF